eukprot:gnl/TRDRNA2_/TRDRNA2_153790_c0_seq1.p1 gnl/TRDRNA2_/TRDRNA2_153790_c0~~gnl/TRDRNA2_/TRDRNA2_153790_c0_seq1.p1  ORF type:complete len:682 (-),score=151.25 gnl/TRDRNA2_/TRDRNA2_153790_c0_seq1:110-1993(-)
MVPPAAVSPDLNAAASSAHGKESAHGQARVQQSVVSSGPSPSHKQKAMNLEAELQAMRCDFEELRSEHAAMRSEHADTFERERLQWRQEVTALHDELRRAHLERQEGEDELTQAREALLSGEMSTSLAEASLAQARQELYAETSLSEDVHKWQAEALESGAKLAEAQSQNEAIQKKYEATRRHAIESERQRKDLARCAGTAECLQLRSELEAHSKEKQAMASRLKRASVTTESSHGHLERLREEHTAEMEAATHHYAQSQRHEMELHKAREMHQTSHRKMRSRMENLSSELIEARRLKHDTHVELAKEQRQRLDEGKRLQGKADAVRAKANKEVEELREQLQHVEKALREAQADVRQMEQSGYRRQSSREPHGYEAPRGVSHSSRSREPHDSAASRARSHSQPRERNLHVGIVEAGTVNGAHGGSKNRAGSSRGYDRTPSSSSMRSSSHHGQAGTGSTGSFSEARPLPAASDLDRYPEHAHRDHQHAVEVEDAAKNGIAREDREKSIIEAETGSDQISTQVAFSADVQTSATEDTPESSQLDDSDSKVHVAAAGSRNLGIARVDVPYWNSASAHLFDMIERAKERADQRRLLSSAAEEVKARASALEELLDREGQAFVDDVKQPAEA